MNIKTSVGGKMCYAKAKEKNHNRSKHSSYCAIACHPNSNNIKQ